MDKKENVAVPVSSLKEQQKIVSELNELIKITNVLKTNYQNKLLALDELKKSLLQKAFTGELTAKDFA